MPFAVCAFACPALASRQPEQALSLQWQPPLDAGELEEAGRQIERRYRFVDRAACLYTGTAQDHPHSQQILVRNRMLEIQTVIAEQLAVVGGEYDQRLALQAEVAYRIQNPADAVV